MKVLFHKDILKLTDLYRERKSKRIEIKFKTQYPTQMKPKPEVVTLDDSAVMINETGDISVQEVAHEEIVGEELPGMFF